MHLKINFSDDKNLKQIYADVRICENIFGVNFVDKIKN